MKMKHPLLQKHLAERTIWKEGSPEFGEYVGRAFDGVVVTFGTYDTRYRKFSAESQIEKYLSDNPTPETW
jgi:hypothetical protein